VLRRKKTQPPKSPSDDGLAGLNEENGLPPKLTFSNPRGYPEKGPPRSKKKKVFLATLQKLSISRCWADPRSS